MAKERPIAACDHRVGVPEHGFDRVTYRGSLPIVAMKRTDTKYDLRDLLLGRAMTMPVETLQHASQPSTLLFRQACVRRDGTPVKGREQTADRFKPVEPFKTQGNEGRNRPGTLCLTMMD